MASREEASLQPRRCSAALRVVLDSARTAPRVRVDARTAPRTYRRVLRECAGSRPLQPAAKLATQRRIALLTSYALRALVAVDVFSNCVFRLSFEHAYG